MKVTFHKNIAAYSGKDKWQKCIYSSTLNGTACTIRRYIKPRETDQQIYFGKAAWKISELWAAAHLGYKGDMMIYSWLIKNTKEFQGKYMTSSYGWFIKIFWKLMKENDIKPENMGIDVFLDGCQSVKASVDNAYLPKVDKIDELTNNIG